MKSHIAKSTSSIPRASSQPQLSFQFLFLAAQIIFIIPPAASIAIKKDVSAAIEFIGVTKQQTPVAMLNTPTMSDIHQYLKNIPLVCMAVVFLVLDANLEAPFFLIVTFCC